MTIHPPEAYVGETGTGKGRGAFAGRDYASGEIVERCPVVVIEPHADLPDALRRIAFNWGVLAGTGASSAIALGFGSIYNHDNPANMRYAAVVDPELLVFSTVRAVSKGEELTINYNARGGGPTSDDDHWFESNQVTLITGR